MQDQTFRMPEQQLCLFYFYLNALLLWLNKDWALQLKISFAGKIACQRMSSLVCFRQLIGSLNIKVLTTQAILPGLFAHLPLICSLCLKNIFIPQRKPACQVWENWALGK